MVTLLRIHRACTRVHMAHHAQPQREARRAAPRDILRAIRRVAERLRFEHTDAAGAAAPDVRRAGCHGVPVLCGVVCELDTPSILHHKL